MTENKISISIPMDDFNAALSKLQEVQTLLAPYLVALSSDQRMSLPKMGDKTFSFVEKSMQFAQSKPELMPGFIDLTEWQKDVNGRNQLDQLFRLVEQLASNIDDTSLLCGSDAYVSSLGFYNSIKQAAKMNVPNAKPIYDELQKRFPGRPTAKQAEPV